MPDITLPDINERHPEAYTIHAARYAKGKYVIFTLDDEEGFVGIAGRCAYDLNLKWVNRSHGYTASPAQVRKFEEAYHEMATPPFEKWRDGYPILTNSLRNVLDRVRIQVVTEHGFRVVAYSRNGKRELAPLYGNDENGRALYAQAIAAVPSAN